MDANKTNAVQRLLIAAYLDSDEVKFMTPSKSMLGLEGLPELSADAAEEIEPEFEELCKELKSKHVEHLTFHDHITALASLQGLINVLADLGWDVDRQNKKGAVLNNSEFGDIELKVDDETHVSIYRR